MYTLFHAGETVEVTYERNGERHIVEVQPTYDEEQGRYRYGIDGSGEYTKVGPIKTLHYSVYEVKYWIQYTVGKPENASDPSGQCQRSVRSGWNCKNHRGYLRYEQVGWCILRLDEFAESGVAAVGKPWCDEFASDSGTGRWSSCISGDRGDSWKARQ